MHNKIFFFFGVWGAFSFFRAILVTKKPPTFIQLSKNTLWKNISVKPTSIFKSLQDFGHFLCPVVSPQDGEVKPACRVHTRWGHYTIGKRPFFISKIRLIASSKQTEIFLSANNQYFPQRATHKLFVFSIYILALCWKSTEYPIQCLK